MNRTEVNNWPVSKRALAGTHTETPRAGIASLD